jgi:hypothetical protein
VSLRRQSQGSVSIGVRFFPPQAACISYCPCSDASAIIPGIDCFAQIQSPCSEVLCQFAVIEQLWPFSEDQFGGYDQGCFLVELQEQVQLDHLLVESSCHDCISVI